jgi:hypothetical protein
MYGNDVDARILLLWIHHLKVKLLNWNGEELLSLG